MRENNFRKISFRVWNIETKKISYPFSIQECSWGILGDVSEFNCPGFSGGIDVEVMQWTGLLDKNRKEIYEGDILEYRPNDNEERIFPDRYIVQWNKFGFIGQWVGGKSSFEMNNGLLDSHIDIEIVGNIYENPELLTK